MAPSSQSAGPQTAEGIADAKSGWNATYTTTLTTYPALGQSVVETLIVYTKTDRLRGLTYSTGTATPGGGLLPVQSQTTSGPTTTTLSTSSKSTSESSRAPGPSVSRSTTSATSATSSTTSASPTSGPSHGNTPYSAAALAGGIVGGALGAAIIAVLATIFLCRRRNSSRSASQQRYEDNSPRWTPVKGGALVGEKSSPASDNYGLGWQAFLPDSKDDRTIQNAAKTLFDQIELHVDNYYTKAQVQIDDSVRADLALLDSERLPAPIAQMMENPQGVLPTIKHCIANLLIGKITPGDNTARSLLPARFATFPSRLSNTSMPAGEYHATQQAYSQWKRLSTFLFPLTQQEPTDQRRLQSVSNELSESIYLAFMPWQSPRADEEALKQHERSLMARASEVGQLILSQPSTYEFEWTNSSGGSVFDVLPGFAKTSDAQGRPLESPQPLVPVTSAKL